MGDKIKTKKEKNDLSENELADNLVQDVSGGWSASCQDKETIQKFKNMSTQLCVKAGKFSR